MILNLHNTIATYSILIPTVSKTLSGFFQKYSSYLGDNELFQYVSSYYGIKNYRNWKSKYCKNHKFLTFSDYQEMFQILKQNFDNFFQEQESLVSGYDDDIFEDGTFVKRPWTLCCFPA